MAGGESVVTTSPDLLDVAGVELTVVGDAGEGDVFIGAGHPDHVSDVQRTRVTALAADGIGDSSAAEGEAPEVGFGYTLPGIFVTGVVLGVGGLLLIVGLVVVGRGNRWSRENAVEELTTPDAEHSDATKVSTVGRVVAVGAVGLLVAGCTSVPRPVEHGEDPGVVPMTQDGAQAMFDDHDERNNAAIEKSHEGDGSAWEYADTGPHLAIDATAARVNAVEPPADEPGTYTHVAGDVFTRPQ